jgi:hypothetical protein
MVNQEMRRSLKLEEKIAKIIGEAEQYPIVKAYGQPIVASFAIPTSENPKLVIFCRSIKDFEEASRKVDETPEEFALRVIDHQVMCIKKVNPAIVAVVVLSDYNTQRLAVESAERIVNSIDLILINEEVKHLPEAIKTLLKES